MGMLPKLFRCACGATVGRGSRSSHRNSTDCSERHRDGPAIVRGVLSAQLGLVRGAGVASPTDVGTYWEEMSIPTDVSARIDFMLVVGGGFHFIEVDGAYHHLGNVAVTEDPARMSRISAWFRERYPDTALEWHRVTVERYRVGLYMEDRLMCERRQVLAAAWSVPPRRGLSVTYYWYDARNSTSAKPSIRDRALFPVFWSRCARLVIRRLYCLHALERREKMLMLV